jgi:hypothetical protein
MTMATTIKQSPPLAHWYWAVLSLDPFPPGKGEILPTESPKLYHTRDAARIAGDVYRRAGLPVRVVHVFACAPKRSRSSK